MGCGCGTYYIPVYMLRFWRKRLASLEPTISAYINYRVKNFDPRVNWVHIYAWMLTRPSVTTELISSSNVPKFTWTTMDAKLPTNGWDPLHHWIDRVLWIFVLLLRTRCVPFHAIFQHSSMFTGFCFRQRPSWDERIDVDLIGSRSFLVMCT